MRVKDLVSIEKHKKYREKRNKLNEKIINSLENFDHTLDQLVRINEIINE